MKHFFVLAGLSLLIVIIAGAVGFGGGLGGGLGTSVAGARLVFGIALVFLAGSIAGGLVNRV